MRAFCGIIMAMLLASCSGRVAREQAALSAIIGQEISLPAEMVWQVQNTTIDYDSTQADYRILTYIDSAGCTPLRDEAPSMERRDGRIGFSTRHRHRASHDC